MRIIGEERVRTPRQGASGPGLRAPRPAIEAYADHRGAVLIRRFTEMKSGGNADRS
jgi:hypothetical protein